jgi:hypothetical protein
MDHEVGPWRLAFFPWSNFLQKSFTKSLGLSLGVKQMWFKRNDHAPKSECADFFKFFNTWPQKGGFEKKKLSLTHSIVVSCLHLLFPKKTIHKKNHYNNISLSWDFAFFTRAHVLPLPQQNPLDHVSG